MIVRKGFCRESKLVEVFGGGVVVLSPNPCPDPTCRHPSAAMGKTAMHRHLNTFGYWCPRGSLLALVCISTKILVGTLVHSSPSIWVGVVTDGQEQRGGEWLTHKVVVADKGRLHKKITGLFGNFSQMADPPILGILTIFYQFLLVKLEIFG